MRFPNMGSKQNIEGRFLGRCSCAIIRLMESYSVVCGFIDEIRGEICTTERWSSLM